MAVSTHHVTQTKRMKRLVGGQILSVLNIGASNQGNQTERPVLGIIPFPSWLGLGINCKAENTNEGNLSQYNCSNKCFVRHCKERRMSPARQGGVN